MNLRKAAEHAALALEAWDQLADYQLDGTAEANAALREADAAGARALAALRRALAEPDETEAVLAEREACAQICDAEAADWANDEEHWGWGYAAGARTLAAKIRARGQK